MYCWKQTRNPLTHFIQAFNKYQPRWMNKPRTMTKLDARKKLTDVSLIKYQLTNEQTEDDDEVRCEKKLTDVSRINIHPTHSQGSRMRTFNCCKIKRIPIVEYGRQFKIMQTSGNPLLLLCFSQQWSFCRLNRLVCIRLENKIPSKIRNINCVSTI